MSTRVANCCKKCPSNKSWRGDNNLKGLVEENSNAAEIMKVTDIGTNV